MNGEKLICGGGWFRMAALTWLLLAISCGVVNAEPNAEEKKLFKAAQQAVQDELYVYAEAKLKTLLRDHPGSEFEGEARAWMGEAQHKMGRHEFAIATLKPSLKDDVWKDLALFYVAESCSALKQHDKAEEFYRRLMVETPASRFVPHANLGLAWSLLQSEKQEKNAEGEKLLKTLSTRFARDEVGQMATVLQARWLIVQNRSDDAAKMLLDFLATKPAPHAKFEASLWLGEIALVKNDFSEALARFQLITQDKRAFPKPILMRAWLKQGEAAMQRKDWSQAAACFETLIQKNDDEETLLVAVRRSIEASRGAGQLKEGLANLRKLFKEDNRNPAAAACLFAIGEAQMQDQQNDAAALTWSQVVENFPGTTWRALSLQQIGEIQMLQKNIHKGIQFFQQAILENPNPFFAGQTQFRLGEIHFNQGQFPESVAAFLAVTENSSAHPLKEKAFFNALTALSKQGKGDEFNSLYQKFSQLFPQSLLREQALEEQASLLARSNQFSKAREIWSQILKLFPKSTQRDQIFLALGKSFFNESRFGEAVEQFDRLIKEMPDSPLVVQAEYLRASSLYCGQKENTDTILEYIKALVKRSPQSPMVPDMQFRIGQIYFEKGDMSGAQTQFLLLAQNYPSHQLADEALYFAGLAALKRENTPDAIALFERLAQQFPASKRLWDARIGQGHALRIQGKFTESMSVYDAILKQPVPPHCATLAMLGKGDCLFRLATDEPKRYASALDAYDAVLKREKNRVDILNEAGWKKARTLDKMKRATDALEAYLDIIYDRVLAAENSTPRTPEYYWFGRAVSDAGRLLEEKEDWNGALALYQLAEKRGGPESATWRDRRLKLQREHFIYE